MEIRSCNRDGGGPSGIGVQALVSNYPVLLRLRVLVVSDLGNGSEMSQVGDRKVSTSEPLTTHRDVVSNVKTGEEDLPQDKSNGDLITELDGVRCAGGTILSQALSRNVGTCRSDAKGDVQVTRITRARVPTLSTGAEQPVVAMKPINVGGAKGLCRLGLFICQPEMEGAA